MLHIIFPLTPTVFLMRVLESQPKYRQGFSIEKNWGRLLNSRKKIKEAFYKGEFYR